MIVVITGGRNFNDRKVVFKVLDKLHAKWPITLLIEAGNPCYVTPIGLL